jgi:hypothetical protein
LLEIFEFRNYLRGETFEQFGPKKTQLSNEIWVPSGRNSGPGQPPLPRLPPHRARYAHARLTAQRDEVDAAFQAIDASAAAIPAPRPGRRVPLDLAYHPKGLPPAAAGSAALVPSLTQMADPECKTNLRAQRSFAQASQLGVWLELMASASGGARRRGARHEGRWRCASARGSSAWRSRWRARGCRPSRAPTSSGCARG